jgi:uncharacterized membrane protein YdjX (TVP38/TMEM64 family)
MKRPRARRAAIGRALVYIYHPVATKLLVTFVVLGLLLLVVLQPAGQEALDGIHAALSAALWPSVILLALLFALGTLSVFYPEFLVTVAAGFLLGTLAGSLFSIVAITICASGNFLIARRYGNHVIHLLFDSLSRAEIRWTATRVTPVMIFLTWVLPSINFDLISYAGGLSPMPYRTFLGLTVVGNLVSSVLLAFLGASLRSDSSVVAVVILLLYTLIGTILYVKELPPRLLTPDEGGREDLNESEP